MSDVHFVWKKNGVPINVTSAVLGYSASDFGVKRNDTGATVVNAATAVPNIATGTYQKSFADPKEDLTYTYRVKTIFEGETYKFEDTFTGPVSSNELDLEYQDLYKEVSEYLGTGRNPSGEALQRAQRRAQSGFREFLMADGDYSWTFLVGTTALTLNAGSTAADLPADFGQIIDDFSFGASGSGVGLEPCSPQMIQDFYAGGGNASGTPQCYAIRAKPFNSAVGQRYEVATYPAAGSTTTFYYRYRRNESALAAQVVGRPELHEALREKCLAKAEVFDNDNVRYPGPHMQEAERLLTRAIRLDARNQPRTVGYNADLSGQRGPVFSRLGTLTWEGES